jgi:predicted homoserine dehydrogenase-like protein
MSKSKTSAFTGNLPLDLARRQSELGRPIRVGLIGCGEMGTDIVTQCGIMKGITVAAIAERRPGAAQNALDIAGRPNSSVTETDSAMTVAIESGRTAITDRG